jgi:hypothetical protein
MKMIKNAAGQIHCLDGPAFCPDEDTDMYYVDGVLHREDGPAVVFKKSPIDNLYIFMGVGLNAAGADIGKKIIENPEELTVDEVNKIENEEIRRIAIDRMGAERFLEAANALIVDQCVNDIDGTKEALFKAGNILYFCGICRSTGRVYYIPINPEIKTCEEARFFMSSGKDVKKCVGAS